MRKAPLALTEPSLQAAAYAGRKVWSVPLPLLLLCAPGLHAAWGACCEDLGNCSAAEPRSGPSCPVIAATDTEDELVRKVDELRDALDELQSATIAKAQQGVETAALQIATEAQLLQTRISSTEKFATEVIRWPLVAKGSPLLKGEEPADDAVIEAELNAALEEVKRLALAGTKTTASILLLTQEAQKDAIAGAQSVRSRPTSAALARPDSAEDCLQSLLSHPDRMLDPTCSADSTPDSLAKNLKRLSEEIVDSVTTKATEDLQGTDALFKKVSELAGREKKITNAMEDLKILRSTDALKVLCDLVPLPGLPMRGVAAAEGSTSTVISRLQAMQTTAMTQLDVGALLAKLATTRDQAVAVPKQKVERIASGITELKAFALQVRSSRTDPSRLQMAISR